MLRTKLVPAILCAALALLSSSLLASPAQMQARSTQRETSDKPTRLRTAEKCLARGDDECIVRVLEGWAHSREELGLLLETDRKLGQNELARQVMQTYVERFPDAPRAASYRRMLGDDAPRLPQPSAARDFAPKKPIDQAAACLARGDNACVVRVLDGKAHTADELGMLCETLLALGEQARARAVMRDYVALYPDAPRSYHYRQVLESP